MGKGDTPRPRQISREEYDLRWEYATTDMTLEEFYSKLKKVPKRKR